MDSSFKMNSSFMETPASKNDTNKTEQDEKRGDKKDRYNENKVIAAFLNGSKGIPFLLDSKRDAPEIHGKGKESDIVEKIDEIIDFYTCWTSSFPSRKNLKITKYEFLKYVEKYVAKSEVNTQFYNLFEK
ncbi:hypothetical protein ENBRE01_1764 [Enteropsectra breve]|nr:hypothetical protein ENBRE01_1764 [Enteropsectra breve]